MYLYMKGIIQLFCKYTTVLQSHLWGFTHKCVISSLNSLVCIIFQKESQYSLKIRLKLYDSLEKHPRPIPKIWDWHCYYSTLLSSSWNGWNPMYFPWKIQDSPVSAQEISEILLSSMPWSIQYAKLMFGLVENTEILVSPTCQSFYIQ